MCTFTFRKLYFNSILRKIDLYGMYVLHLFQIQADLRTRLVISGLPPRPDILIGYKFRALPGRNTHRLTVRKQHPFRLLPGAAIHTKRPIPIPLITVQLSIGIKTCLPQAKPAFKFMIAADTHRRNMPESLPGILHSGSMSGSGYDKIYFKRAALIRYAVMRHDGEREPG